VVGIIIFSTEELINSLIFLNPKIKGRKQGITRIYYKKGIHQEAGRDKNLNGLGLFCK